MNQKWANFLVELVGNDNIPDSESLDNNYSNNIGELIWKFSWFKKNNFIKNFYILIYHFSIIIIYIFILSEIL